MPESERRSATGDYPGVSCKEAGKAGGGGCQKSGTFPDDVPGGKWNGWWDGK